VSRAVDRYLELTPGDFPYLRRLAIVERVGKVGVDIDIEMEFYGDRERCLVVRCSGVRNLVFRQPFTTDMKLHSLHVDDVSSRQLEDIQFRVRDLEEECLSFSCRTFDAELRAT